MIFELFIMAKQAARAAWLLSLVPDMISRHPHKPYIISPLEIMITITSSRFNEHCSRIRPHLRVMFILH